MEVKRLSEEKRKMCVVLKEGSELISESYHEDRKTIGDFSDQEKAILEDLLQENNLERDQVQSVYIRKDTDDSCIYISDHAFKRMKERNGWGQKTCLRMVKKIIECGTAEKKEKYLENQAKRLEEMENAKVLMYGNTLYLFMNNVLVTVYEPTKRKGASCSRYKEKRVSYKKQKKYKEKRAEKVIERNFVTSMMFAAV